MTPQGGTEIMVRGLQHRMPVHTWDHINLITSVCDPVLIDPHKKNVLWQHLNVDQPAVQGITNPDFWQALHAVVFVSHWQAEQFRKTFQLPMHKCVVIPNCVQPAPITPKLDAPIKHITYTSTPWRGLEVLLQSVSLLNRSDYHVHVFSSTLIYGDEFHAQQHDQYAHLWDACEKLPQVTLHGYQPHDVILNHLAHKCDIWALPSIWEETFCLSALEALSAGCKVVTTGLGALPELCGAWAHTVAFAPNPQVLSLRFAQALDHVLNLDNLQNMSQAAYYQQNYSWDNVLPKWQQLFGYLTS